MDTPRTQVDVVRRVGRYEILGELGRSRSSRVFLARRADVERLVALKERVADGGVAETPPLSHPNIVLVHEAFEQDGARYVAMEVMERGSLRPYVGRLSLAQVGGVLEAVLAALVHAEEHGVVHGRVAPENVLVTGDGRVKLTDFGTASDGAAGDARYRAPEQVREEEVGPETDLFAVGAMAAELLGGRMPSAAEVVAGGSFAAAAGVQPPLAGWIDRLVVADPTQRQASAEEAWDALEDVLVDLLGPRWRREARLGEPPAPVAPPPAAEPRRFERAPETFVVQEPAPAPPPASRPPSAPLPPMGGSPPAPAPPVGERAEQVPAPFVVDAPPATAEPPPADVETAVPPTPEARGVDVESGREPDAPVRLADLEPTRAATAAAGAAPTAAVGSTAEPGEPARDAPSRGRRRTVVGALVLAAAVAAGAAAGAIVGRSAPAAQGTMVVRAGDVSTRVPADYRRVLAPDVPGLALGGAPAVAPPGVPGGAAVMIGMTTSDDPSLLPPAFRRALGGTPDRTAVRLDDSGLQAYRYAGLRPSYFDGDVRLYVSPTSAGVAVVACVGTSTAAAALRAACDGAASALAVRADRRFAVGPDPAYARRLTATLADLRAAVVRGRRALRTPGATFTQQGAAAARIGAAYVAADGALGRATLSPADRGLNRRLRERLEQAATAWKDAADTARAQDVAGFAAAEPAIRRAERAVRRAVAALDEAGYTVRA
jgi:hypothetical protein